MPEDVSHRLSPSELELFDSTVWRGTGCSKCNESGYHGRIGFFELVLINPTLRRAMSENRPAGELQAAIDKSFVNMRRDGLEKAAQGRTTIEEVLRATQDTEDSVV